MNYQLKVICCQRGNIFTVQTLNNRKRAMYAEKCLYFYKPFSDTFQLMQKIVRSYNVEFIHDFACQKLLKHKTS